MESLTKTEMEGFQERQKQLYALSSFISEHEQWLQSFLNRLGWNRESLEQHNHEKPPLVQCPINKHHYVPLCSLEEHKKTCRYATLGVDPTLIEDTIQYKPPDIRISPAVASAVRKVAKSTIDSSSTLKSHDNHVIQEHFASLEDTHSGPVDIATWKPHQVISYIKSWTLVPSDFAALSMSTVNQAQVKGWLFKNLPSTHTLSSRLGGEITAVESIMESLLGAGHDDQTISPNTLMKKLRPLLGLKSRKFVLDLWKFIHISRVQLEHDISDIFVEDIAPMQPLHVNNQPKEQEEENPAISEIIEAIAVEEGEGSSQESSLPLPMDQVFYTWTTAERRMMYDFVVDITKSHSNTTKVEDPDLYRDDTAAIKAKLKQASKEEPELDEEGLGYLEVLKRKRDYKRRRQSYRAKNVHITRRSTAEVFRAIIDNRMEEITAALTDGDHGQVDAENTTSPPAHKPRDKQREDSKRDSDREKSPGYRTQSSPAHRRPSRHSEVSSSTGSYSRRESLRGRSRSRSRERRGHERKMVSDRRSDHPRERDDVKKHRHRHHRSRSKDRSRSRSRERERNRHKKHKKHSRSHSRDRH